MTALRQLPSAWLRTAEAVGARGDVAGVGARLLAAWAEPHRRYHDLRHLDTVLRHVDDLAGYARDPDAVRLAAWFHDAVYDPAASDNEERSAEVAERELAALSVDAGRVAEVVRLVLLTADHTPDPSDADGAVLCDADLSVLASPPELYDGYAAAVREEYAHVPDDAFAAGRSAVLLSLLELPQLYRCEPAREWEPAARRNLTAELRRWDDAGAAPRR